MLESEDSRDVQVLMSQRALIVKLGAIGDVVMALPAVRLLHEAGMQIDWVCGRTVLPLLSCYSWLRPIECDDRTVLSGNVVERARSISSLWRMIGWKQYDLCATLYYEPRYKLLTMPVRAKRRLIFSRSSRERFLIPGRNHADEYARLLLDREDTCNDLSLSPVYPDKISGLPLVARTKGRKIALVPAGASNTLRQQTLRRWPVENYVALAKELLMRGYEVLLLGGPDDVWVRPYFGQMAVTDCLGALTLPQVVSACNECDVVVSHDTGPLHLAGLSDAAVVGLFGPTDPGNFLPRREYVTGIWGGVNFACRPCYDGRDFAPCKHNGCMRQITPEMVLREVDSLLEAKASGLPAPPQIVFPRA
jgi:heptosyltransferase-2